ncbi:MAG TPA: hypothetical protein VFG54_05615 [Prolixibacteraceae bacterium]|nr:hypothetical protein [Prolixibacteraceae bacterium]
MSYIKTIYARLTSPGLGYTPGSKLIRLFLPAAILFMLNYSCSKSLDPTVETIENYNFTASWEKEMAVGGEYLVDSIYIQVQNLISPFLLKDFRVEFKVISGGGSVDQPVVLTRQDGVAATRWKLGTQSFSQQMIAKIYSPEGKFLSEIPLSVYGILYNAWNEVDYHPLSQLSDIVADTVTHQSWLISTGKVYKRGANFLDWQQIDEPKLKGVREIEIDKNGVVYIGTWYGELFKSTDHGASWIQCTNPIPDRPYYFYFWITNDGDLWATHYERGLWHSKDGGTTWLNPVNVSGTYFNMSGIFRLKNGWLLSLIDENGVKTVVMKSEDDGTTWTQLPTPTFPYSFFVSEKEEIIVCTQGMFAGIHKSTDLGQTYKLVHSVPVTFGSGSKQTYVQKFRSFYYMAVPGFGVLKTLNFEQFETILSEPNVNGLYIDHVGTVVAMGWHEKLNRSFFYGIK